MRITNTRTGRTTQAKDGRDLADMVKIELDRRSGMAATAAVQTPTERAADMAEANRVHRQAVGS